MLHALGLILASIFRLFRSRRCLLLENLALRQQLVVLKRKRPRQRFKLFDKVFWVLMRRLWSGWEQSLIFRMVAENATRRRKALNMPVCYLRLAVESNPYAVDLKGGQGFGEAQDRDQPSACAL
jgi:hypothetical protein